MGGARALIASLGASISLVAGAALSLLVVSFVFAYDGLAGSGFEGSISHARVVVSDPDPVTTIGRADGSGAAKVVVSAPAPRAPAQGKAASGDNSASVQARKAAGSRTVIAPPPPATTDPSAGIDPQAPAAGESVRELGDSVSATVDGTGQSAGNVAAPLGPPVSQAVQEILNLLNGLIEGATGGLGATLDNATR